MSSSHEQRLLLYGDGLGDEDRCAVTVCGVWVGLVACHGGGSGYLRHKPIFPNFFKLLTDCVDIELLWAPGHSGLAENEKADLSAKQALALPNTSDIPIERTSTKPLIVSPCNRLK